MSYAIKLDKPQKIKLHDINTADTGKAEKKKSEDELAELGNDLCELQEWLYAAQTHSVLIVLQGMDTSGKDGTISNVMASINPQGCAVASFKAPTPEELSHDFLWRIHKRTPSKGWMTIFNRSHYEDVLVTRVHKLIDKETCEGRCARIVNFESLLADNKTIILKFFLHISKDEQERRLLDREQEPEKAWKLSATDWHERQYWGDYTNAYEDALGATAAKNAPWYIVPANHKWYRNLAIAETLVHTLRPYKDDWKKTLEKIGEERKAELAKMREESGSAASSESSHK